MGDKPNIEQSRAVERRPLESWLNWGTEFLGFGVLRLQGILILVALAVWTFLRIVGASTSLPLNLLFTLCVGNWVSFLVFRVQSLFVHKRAPWKWIVFLI